MYVRAAVYFNCKLQIALFFIEFLDRTLGPFVANTHKQGSTEAKM